MIIQNAALKGKKGLWQITIEEGKFTSIKPQPEAAEKNNGYIGCQWLIGAAAIY